VPSRPDRAFQESSLEGQPMDDTTLHELGEILAFGPLEGLDIGPIPLGHKEALVKASTLAGAPTLEEGLALITAHLAGCGDWGGLQRVRRSCPRPVDAARRTRSRRTDTAIGTTIRTTKRASHTPRVI
jgi:hypothetical protein